MSNYVLILKKISHDENEEFAVYPKKLCILFFQYVLHTYITHLVALCNHSKSITCSQILYSDCDLFGTMGSRCAFGFIKSSVTLLRSSSNLHGDILNIQKKKSGSINIISLTDRRSSPFFYISHGACLTHSQILLSSTDSAYSSPLRILPVYGFFRGLGTRVIFFSTNQIAVFNFWKESKVLIMNQKNSSIIANQVPYPRVLLYF